MENWEETEEIVKLLEEAISPEAQIERNVWLPDLNSTEGAKCQCDIVIRNGKSPRETISIVEVQHRDSKVEINTFRGWCQKMRDVGAQHLICVSRKGFPKSIKEKALKMGPTVRLLTLKQLETTDQWPLDFFANVIQNPRRELTRVFDAELHYENNEDTAPEELDIKLDTSNFQYNGRWMSPKDLFFAYLDFLEWKGSKFNNGTHIIEMNLPLENDVLLYNTGDVLKKVISLSASYEMSILNRKMTLTSSEYTQISFGESIAWLLEASVYLNDKERKIKFVFVPLDDGSYRLVSRFF